MDTVTRPTTDARPDAPLTLADRCDRCGSRAYVRATLPTGSELLLCAHHGNEHRAALLVAGAVLHDESDALTVARESSAA